MAEKILSLNLLPYNGDIIVLPPGPKIMALRAKFGRNLEQVQRNLAGKTVTGITSLNKWRKRFSTDEDSPLGRATPLFGTIGSGKQWDGQQCLLSLKKHREVTSPQQMFPAPPPPPPFLPNRLQFLSVSFCAAPSCLPLYTLPSFSISRHTRTETEPWNKWWCSEKKALASIQTRSWKSSSDCLDRSCHLSTDA